MNLETSEPMTNRELAKHAVEVLNRAFKSDPVAIEQLFNVRVDCNDALANDPTIQVGQVVGADNYSVGAIGIINGICGTMRESSWGYVALVYSVECPEHGKQDGSIAETCPVDGCTIDLQMGGLEGFQVLDER